MLTSLPSNLALVNLFAGGGVLFEERRIMAFGFSVTTASIGFSALALALGLSGLSHADTIQIDPSGGTVLFEGEVIDQDFLRDPSREIVGVGVVDGDGNYFTILDNQEPRLTETNVDSIFSGKAHSTVLTTTGQTKAINFSGTDIAVPSVDFEPLGSGFDGILVGQCNGLIPAVGGSCDPTSVFLTPGTADTGFLFDREDDLVAGVNLVGELFTVDLGSEEASVSNVIASPSELVRLDNGAAVSASGAFLTLDGTEGQLPDGFSGEGANVSFITGLMDDMVGLFDISTLALLETLIFPGTVDRFLIDNDNNWNALVNGSSIAFSGTLPGGAGVPGTPPVTAVPLPAPFALLLAALIGLGIVGRRKGLAAA